MKIPIFWVATIAVFAVIGMMSAYLTHPLYTIGGTFAGLVVGVGVAAMAMAGERIK